MLNDSAHGVAVSGSGEVYVAGHTGGDLEGMSAGAIDAFVRKYDGGGSIGWTRQFGSTSTDQAHAVAVHGSNVYVAGVTFGTLQFGIDEHDRATGIAAGGDGGIYLAGVIESDVDRTQADGFVRKYDADGNDLWTQRFGSGGFDEVKALALDVDGNAFVVGQTRGPCRNERRSRRRLRDPSAGTLTLASVHPAS